MKNGLPVRSMSVLREVKPGVGASRRCFSERTSLTRAATPAAVVVCPMFALTEPRPQRPGASPKASFSALTSIGSPSGVAVPCAST